MILLAIDPGTYDSALVWLDTVTQMPVAKELCSNSDAMAYVRGDTSGHLAIEEIVSYGASVGHETFDTCRMIGRMQEAFVWQVWGGDESRVSLIRRKTVGKTICLNGNAKDPQIRQAVIDRFAPSGGGKCRQVGIKTAPGPLFGFRKDLWSALAIGLAWCELHHEEARKQTDLSYPSETCLLPPDGEKGAK